MRPATATPAAATTDPVDFNRCVENAAALAALGSPAFACTPDLFPNLIAAAIQRQDIATWAAMNDLVASRNRG